MTGIQWSKVWGDVVLGVLFICCFLFISPTLIIDYGAGITMSFKLTVVAIGLLVIVLYNIFHRSSPLTTKLGLTAILTECWLALIIFYPFKDPNNSAAGAVGFFTLIGGLAVSVLWVYFFSDELT
ncbi:MAG TPA: hypothetical protein VKV40_18900 [Ktedonobacteraceae bacterium]|nr:hypothetical protein [Ktedonobacteraceae bacterium]